MIIIISIQTVSPEAFVGLVLPTQAWTLIWMKHMCGFLCGGAKEKYCTRNCIGDDDDDDGFIGLNVGR